MTDTINVLIVDDSEDDRDLYMRLLAKDDVRPYRFFEASRASEAIESFNSLDIDCVLLDYHMPGRDGMQVLGELKNHQKHVPVVMLTGQGNEKIAANAIKNGAQDYLSKSDITASALHRVISNTVERTEMLRKIDAQQDDLATFASILAHDLKAPINVIWGMNNLIKEALEEESYDEIEELTDRIERSTRLTRELIDTLRVYNKSSNSSKPLVEASLNELLQDALSNLHFEIQQSQAEISYGSLPTVLADPPQIVQLLQNLIGNGIKYCEAVPPKIAISAELVGDYWQINLEDNGIGIEQDSLQTIFKPFTRLHSDDEYTGTGLGLATCRRILDRHRGKIWCESEQSKGSTFHFCLLNANRDADLAGEMDRMDLALQPSKAPDGLAMPV